MVIQMSSIAIPDSELGRLTYNFHAVTVSATTFVSATMIDESDSTMFRIYHMSALRDML